jgi:hypothetical protein
MARARTPRIKVDELDRPWRLRKVPGEAHAQLWKRYLQSAPAHDARVVSLLFERYHIALDDPDCWRKLALALADDYVPAMSASIPGPGAPVKSADVHRFEQIDARVAQGMPARQACFHVAKGNAKEASRLRRAYQRRRKIPR